MENSTKGNKKRVSTVYERVMNAAHAGKDISEQERFVFNIELLSQEVNSGASFEQYFRWVGKPELPEVYSVVEKAIQVAFPDDEDEYEAYTQRTEEQERQLKAFSEKFEQYNGVIINKLGRYIETNKLA